MLWSLKLDGTMQPINERPEASAPVGENVRWTVPSADQNDEVPELAATALVERPHWTPAPAPVSALASAPASAAKSARPAMSARPAARSVRAAQPVRPAQASQPLWTPAASPSDSPAATAVFAPSFPAPVSAPKPVSAPAPAPARIPAPTVSPEAELDSTRVLVMPDSTRYASFSSAPRPEDPRGSYHPAPAGVARLSDAGRPGKPYGGGERGPAESSPRRRNVSRRGVLFAAGGITLLGGLGVFAAQALGAGATHASAAGLPAGRTTNPSPADLSSSPARATTPPTTPPATAGPTTNSTIDPAQVQSKPEYYVNNGPKGIALTLDDGPTAEYTPQVLALLQKYGIIATFCMIGKQIPPNAALVREVVAAGHTVVNHTWDHADQTKITATQVRDSMARTSEALNDVGVTPAVFRAPYGSWNSNVFQACADARLRPLDWSVDPQDWARPGSSVIVQRILKQTSTGSIILEHDGGGDRSQTVAALSVVLPELLNAGYRFGPI